MRNRVRSARKPEPPSPSGSMGSTQFAGTVHGGGPALIAGYRVLRRLGSSARADHYVGAAPAPSAPPGREVRGQMPGASPAPVVLKVFHPATQNLSVERELRALSTLTPGRLPTLIDVGTLPDGRVCLVLEQLTGGALSGFLEGRRRILPGEAVTILAPVVAALAELQAIGLLHPAVSLSTILFDSSGRPVLTGLGELRALPEAGRGQREALEEGRVKLAQVVRAVLDQVQPDLPAPAALRDLDRWCAVPASLAEGRTPGELEHLLFAWAESVPVRLGQTHDAGHGPQSPDDWLRRALPADPAGREPGAEDCVDAGKSRAKRKIGSLVSRARATVRQTKEDNPAGRFRARLGRRIRVHPGPLLIAVLVAVVGTGLALTALTALTALRTEASAGQAGEPGVPPADPAKAASARADETEGEPDGEDADGDETDGAGADGGGPAVSGDDPVVAVQALLRIRARCLGEVSVVCLDGVHQSRSAALAADSYTLRMMQQGGASPEPEDLASWAGVLVERTGDVALVSLQAPDAQRQPASVLVVKGEAGWRIRDIFDY